MSNSVLAKLGDVMDIRSFPNQSKTSITTLDTIKRNPHSRFTLSASPLLGGGVNSKGNSSINLIYRLHSSSENKSYNSVNKIRISLSFRDTLRMYTLYRNENDLVRFRYSLYQVLF